MAAPMPTPRFSCAGATGLDGRIYVLGGGDGTSPGLDTAEAFTPALITSVVAQPGFDSAAISWHVSSLTAIHCELDYGLTPAYGSSIIESGLLPQFAIIGGYPDGATIINLQPNTTYHFRIMAVGSPDTATGDYTFTTGNGLGLDFQHICLKLVGHGRSPITWNTNSPANSTVQYGTSTALPANRSAHRRYSADDRSHHNVDRPFCQHRVPLPGCVNGCS